MKLLYSLLLLIISCTVRITAQTISVSVPQQVAVGEQFKLMYTIQTQDVKGFRGGNVPDGIDVLMGPSTSTQSSFQMINGHTSSSSSITYTYILSAEKVGTYTIGAARAKVSGKNAVSKAVRIKVSGQAQAIHSGGGMQQHPGAQIRQAGSKISGNDLFIKVTANKKTVHEQEPILLTYKVYTQVELTQLEGKMPDLKGFHTQEIPLPQQKSFHIENVNGRPYRCVTWSQYVMYPQMTGKLEIPSITFKGIVVQENTNVDPFEAFFNGGSGYIEVKRNITAHSVLVNVEPLPSRPAGFSGGVGKFSISGSVNKKTVATNDPVTLRIVISGNGNLKLIKQPVVKFPKDFDTYSPKSTDKTKLTGNGLEGSMIYDYLFVPRHQGTYTIPAVEFTYYDIAANAYKTIKTHPQTITVSPGKGTSNTVADFSEKEDDILGLRHADEHTLRKNIIFGSIAYQSIIAAIILGCIVLIWIFRNRAIVNADIVGMKGRKANKIATKRLKRAAKLMRAQKESEFYDEVLRALWGYVGDKLNIPVSELSRENITERLADSNVGKGIISIFVDAIDECEYARYAPGEALGKMSAVYEKAMNGITDIDDFLKSKKSKPSKVEFTLLVFVMTLLCSSASANNTASDAYAKGNYQLAVKRYEQLAQKTPSAENYYNLGNAYYRSDNLAQAIIAYNKASLLAPADKDIAHNLYVARSKTIDKMHPTADTFIVVWWDTVVRLLNTNEWTVLAITSLILVAVLILTFLFSDIMALRKMGFYGGIVMFASFVLCNLCAYSQYHALTANDGAVVITNDSAVKKSPELKSQEETVVHEGTHMNIIDDTISGWYEVRLDDGTEGWVQSNTVKRIVVR
ncbi:MAG: BatD family protein [Bacteroidales bacterium]|nr:BatD family protein [Bacteroidales bacterium]MCM1148336.1 BatD family protein [Bacteroidales bacterium]MCM1206971.1 BatD family protein [Bacillota bacterium]MCM1511267.1 BatD family protein [Clostridium sp.]